MVDPTAATEIASMTDKQFFVLLAAALALVQVLYRIWDKKESKEVIAAIKTSNEATLSAIHENSTATLEAIKETIKTFGPHLERGRKTYGIVRELKGMHDVRDDDGRPMWYMPREIIEMQRELTQMTHTVATTQKHIARILEKQSHDITIGHEKIEKVLAEHQESCKNQYHTIREKMNEEKT